MKNIFNSKAAIFMGVFFAALALFIGVFAAISGGVGEGELSLACLAASISAESCPKSRAGIRKLYIIESSEVTNLVFNANGGITTITASSSFFTITFPKNVAFFNQVKTVPNGSVNIAQTISFTEKGITEALRKQIEDLNNCCSYHVIVEDNNGKQHYAGITYDSDTATYATEDMRTGEGSYNTGADPAADTAQFTETLVANTGSYAPLLVAGTAIP